MNTTGQTIWSRQNAQRKTQKGQCPGEFTGHRKEYIKSKIRAKVIGAHDTFEPEGTRQLMFPTRKINMGARRKMNRQCLEVETPDRKPVEGCSKKEIVSATQIIKIKRKTMNRRYFRKAKTTVENKVSVMGKEKQRNLMIQR